MNSDLYFDGKQYISSSRAAKISGYVNDYIGQLCRDGKLECRMVGRSWYVSFESLISHKNANGGNAKSRAKKSGVYTPVSYVEESQIEETLPVEQTYKGVSIKTFKPDYLNLAEVVTPALADLPSKLESSISPETLISSPYSSELNSYHSAFEKKDRKSVV